MPSAPLRGEGGQSPTLSGSDPVDCGDIVAVVTGPTASGSDPVDCGDSVAVVAVT